MPVYGLPVLRSVLLACALGFIIFLVNSGGWVDTQLADRDQQTVLEESLKVFINEQLQDKNIPGLSISVVNGQETVFEMGFGFSDLEEEIPATPYTIYRGGTIAQLFTTIAILQRVELGYLDLDIPISTYLPKFAPQNPYGHPLNLRQILSHQSGLPTETPVGHALDMTGASLAKTVYSLNEAEIVYPPETFSKFSNAGFGVAGLILETTIEKPFEQYMRAILDRMDMMRTSYSPRLDLKTRLAQGYTTSFENRLSAAAVYEAGNVSALNLYTTANDLATFLKVFFADGKSINGSVLNEQSLEEMWTIQLSTARRRLPYGLGFAVSQFYGEPRASLSSSFQGYSGHIDLLPESKLGVVVLANVDFADVVLTRIARYALQLLKSEINLLPPPQVPRTYPVEKNRMIRAAGYYEDVEPLYVSALDEHLYLYRNGSRNRLRQLGDSLIVDDRHSYGTILLSDGLSIELDNTLYVKKDALAALTPPGTYDALQGAYGLPSTPVILSENRQKLYASIGWLQSYPLNEVAPDTFALPADGNYGGEKLIVLRDENNYVDKIQFAQMVLDRLPDSVYTYSYESIPYTELQSAMVSERIPPVADSSLNESELVDLTMVDPLLNLDVRYASTDNVLSTRLYNEARVLLQLPAAEAFFRIQQKLRPMGYGLKIFDAYRPWSISNAIWQGVPEEYHFFFDDPDGPACQNRGTGISVSVYHLNSGEELPMPTRYGVLDIKAHADYPLLSGEQRHNRAFLRHIMEEEGFMASTDSWWYFNHQSCTSYPILNIPPEEVTQINALSGENIFTVR